MKKMKAGWIGFLKPEDDFWKSVELLSSIGYRGMEGGEALLKGNTLDNIKRFHDMGMQVLTVSADIKDLRQENYDDIVNRAHQLQTDSATVWVCSINSSFWNQEPVYDEVMRDCEAMEKAAEKLNEEGISLCYHNHYQDFLVNFRGISCFDLLIYNTEKLCIELDVGWVTNGLEDPCRVMERIEDRLSAIHVKDYLKGEPREKEGGWAPIFTTVGNGELKLVPVLETAQRLGIKWAVVEQDQMHNLSAMESLTASYLNMKETGIVE
jgi:sugar phosphate isomerase/epimerase